MPTALKQKNPANRLPIKPLIDFAKKSPMQWEKMKGFPRSGKKPPGLSSKSIADFSRLGLDYKEAVNRRSRNPYTGKFTPSEVREIKRQANDLVNLLMPKASLKKKKVVVERLMGRLQLINRGAFESWIVGGINTKEIFNVGRMYLHAIDRHNEPKARRRNLDEDISKGYENHAIVLRKGWMKNKYETTNPFHEMMHGLFGSEEYPAYLTEYYYSLKRGIMGEAYLRRVPIREAESRAVRKSATAKAIELFRIGSERGCAVSDALLRKEVKL